MPEEQHLTALEKANKIRLGRAEIKQNLQAGKENIRKLILEPPEVIQTMTVYELLISQRQWARTRTLRAINKPWLNISENTTVGSLTERQKILLIDVIGKTGKPKT